MTRSILKTSIIAATAGFITVFGCIAPASAQEQTAFTRNIPEGVALTSEVDGCRVWRVSDIPDGGNSYAKLAARYIYFTKCGNLSVPSAPSTQEQEAYKGDMPKNARLLAEVDGCRAWRVGDTPEGGTSYATLEPHYVYFTRCGNVPVPTTAPRQP